MSIHACVRPVSPPMKRPFQEKKTIYNNTTEQFGHKATKPKPHPHSTPSLIETP
jgi:hypothetical protein